MTHNHSSQNELLKLAIETLGSKQAAVEWMSRPCRPLGNVKPEDLLNSDEDICKVETVLGRIQHGVFS